MSSIDKIRNYSVKIECGEKYGSGILYVPDENSPKAYILTVAHIFPNAISEVNEVKIQFYQHESKTYVYNLDAMGDKTETCKIECLAGYEAGDSESPHDGAVLEIQREEWMAVSEYKFQRAVPEKNCQESDIPELLKENMMRLSAVCWRSLGWEGKAQREIIGSVLILISIRK